ncbi:MAG: GyrI-like domain-containing protein [Bacillota bacterium]
MKNLDYKKDFKHLYLPPTKPVLVDVSPALFAVVRERGNPNDNPAFQAAMQALYSLSWTIKMLPKKGIIPEGYYPYTVFPLEGLWDMDVSGMGADIVLDKDKFLWDIMIRQPDFVTGELVDLVKDIAARKKDAPDLSLVELRTITDGLSVQMMHVGPYDAEPASFAKMDEFCASEGLVRVGHIHREIYMGDPRRTDPAKLKTVIRYFVKRAD